jgi:hypothetical protein
VYLKAGRRPKKAMKVRKETDPARMMRLRAKAMSGTPQHATYLVLCTHVYGMVCPLAATRRRWRSDSAI